MKMLAWKINEWPLRSKVIKYYIKLILLPLTSILKFFPQELLLSGIDLPCIAGKNVHRYSLAPLFRSSSVRSSMPSTIPLFTTISWPTICTDYSTGGWISSGTIWATRSAGPKRIRGLRTELRLWPAGCSPSRSQDSPIWAFTTIKCESGAAKTWSSAWKPGCVQPGIKRR